MSRNYFFLRRLELATEFFPLSFFFTQKSLNVLTFTQIKFDQFSSPSLFQSSKPLLNQLYLRLIFSSQTFHAMEGLLSVLVKSFFTVILGLFSLYKFLFSFLSGVLISRFDLNFPGDYDSWSQNIPVNQDSEVLISWSPNLPLHRYK